MLYGGIKGYTIIEVTIVMAISGVLFAAAWGIFGGQNNRTQFSQTMRDVESLVNSYATEVISGALPSGQTYACSIGGTGRPVLDTSSQSGIGTNQDCVFLGRAINVTPQSSNLSIYSVLGDRTAHNGSSDTGVPATTLVQANPEIALDTNGGDVWLSSYTLGGGVKVKSSTITGSSGEFDLVGFYNNLTNNGASASLLGQAYQVTSNVKLCIENDSSCQPTPVTQWNLCMVGGDGTTALLITKIAPSGVTTNVNFASCQ